MIGINGLVAAMNSTFRLIPATSVTGPLPVVKSSSLKSIVCSYFLIKMKSWTKVLGLVVVGVSCLFIQGTDSVGPIDTGILPRRCGPVCRIYCPYGNVLDSRGCPTCRCRDRPSFDICPRVRCNNRCRNGYRKDSRGCKTCRCNLPKVCPRVRCNNLCTNGYRKDSRGCQTCHCNLPKVCPRIACPTIYCPNGFKTDRNGCSTCRCRTRQTPCPQYQCNLICGSSRSRSLKPGGCTCDCSRNPPVHY